MQEFKDALLVGTALAALSTGAYFATRSVLSKGENDKFIPFGWPTAFGPPPKKPKARRRGQVILQYVGEVRHKGAIDPSLRAKRPWAGDANRKPTFVPHYRAVYVDPQVDQFFAR